MKRNYAKNLDKLFASAQQSKAKQKLTKKLAERTLRPMKTVLHELIETDASIEKLRDELEKGKLFHLVNIPDPTNKHSTPLCALIIRFALKKAVKDGNVLEREGGMDFYEDICTKQFTKMGLASAETRASAIENSLFPPLPEHELDRDVDKEDEVQTKCETGKVLDALIRLPPPPPLRDTFNEDDLIERAALLIEYGANLTLNNETGKPLDLAIAHDMPKLVLWLIEKGAKTDVLANPILQGAIWGAGVGKISQTLAHILTLEPKQCPALFGPNPNITHAELINHRYVHSGKQTLLHTSVMHGRLKMLSFLVEQGADINIKDNCKRTPLMLAEQRKFEKAAWYLREVSAIQSQGTDKEAQKKDIYKLGEQLTVEDCAFAVFDRVDFDGRIGNSGQPSSSLRNMLLYQSELESLAYPNARSNTQLNFQKEEPEAFPLDVTELQPLTAAEKAKNKLVRAVKKGDLRRVQHIAENTEPATFQKWLTQSEELFSYEDSLHAYARTMVEYALDEGKEEIFNFLLEYATKINLELKLLSRAVAFANLKRLEALVKLEPKEKGLPTKLANLLVKAVYEASIIKQKSPLKEEYKKIIFYLLNLGIDPNVTNKQFHGFTALHMAAYYQDLEMIEPLIAHGGDASLVLTSENPAHAFLTPLHVVLLRNFLKKKQGKTHSWDEDKAFAIVKFLIEQQGVDVNTGQRNPHTGTQLSPHANTPLDYAINHGEWKIAFYLYRQGGKCQPTAAEFFYAKFPALNPSKNLKEKEFLAQEQQEKWQLVITLLKKYFAEFVNDELLEKSILNGNQFNIEFSTAASAKEFKEALLLVFTSETFQFGELSWQDNHVSFPIDRLCRQEQIKQNAKKRPANEKSMFTKKEYSLLSEKCSLLRSLLASHAMIDSASSTAFRLSRSDLYEYRFKKPEALTSTMLGNFNQHTRGKCQLEDRKRTKKGKPMDCVLLVEKVWIDTATPEEVKEFTEQIMKVDLHKETKIESVTFDVPPKQPVSLDPVMREERERRDRLNRIKQQTYKDQPPKQVSHRGKPLAVENNGQGEQDLNEIEKPVTTQVQDMPKRNSSSLNFSWMHNTDKPGPLEESIFLSEHESSDSLCKEEPKKVSKNQARKNKRAKMSLAEFNKKLAEEEAERARLTQEEKKKSVIKGQEEKKIDSQWYSDEKVFKLIAHYIRDKLDVDCLAPMLGTDWRGNNTLRDNLAEYNAQRAQLIAKGQSIKDKILIPINLYNGHWVLLYVLYQQDMTKTQQIYYFDPMGTAIPEDLYKAIVDERVFPGHPIIQLGQRVQTDFYNCGPWVIEAARTLIDSGAAPESTLNIHAARVKHAEIIRTQKASNASLQPAISATKSHFHPFLAAESATTKQAASPSRAAQEGESSSNIKGSPTPHKEPESGVYARQGL